MKLSFEQRERFEKKFNRSEGCWIWTAAKIKGYGVCRVAKRLWLSHRLSFFLENPSTFDESKFVLHRCDNPACVNPRHLFLGTQADNVEDMIRKGRGKHPTGYSLKGAENPAAKLTEDQVRWILNTVKTKSLTQSQIARALKVTPCTVHGIVNKRIWRHIKDE